MNIKPPSWLRSSLLSIALLLTLGAGCASAAVSHTSDTASSGKNGTGTSIVFTSYAVSGTNPVILLGIALKDATATVSSVVLSAGLSGGTPVQVVSVRDTGSGGGQLSAIWAIPAPSGTGTITATLSASVAWQATASLFAGADQTTPCRSGDAVTDTAATGSVTLTPTNLTANDATYAIGGDDNSDVTGVTPNQTYLDDLTAVNAQAGYRIGTGGVTLAYGSAAHNMAKVAVRIQAPTGGGSPACTDSHMLGVWRCDEAIR